MESITQLNGELNQIIHDVNNTKRIYDNKTLQELFEERVKNRESETAVVYKNQSITYNELNKKANQLARKLREYGIRQNDIVGLMVNRSLDMIIGIMGILKAGGAYLPIDPSYPEARIHYMIDDSGTRTILTHSDLQKNISFSKTVICLDDEELYTGDSSNLENTNDDSDLAYVIYTSGSTGNPKGVMLEHRSVHNFIVGITDQIKFLPEKSIVCLTTISFDIFVLESLLPLIVGMKIIIADPMQLSKYIINEKIDMLQTTPSTIQLILNDKSNLKYLKDLTEIMLGGEAFPKRLLPELKKHTNARIYNMYGPTETTVWSTIKELTFTEDITIGRPIANTQILIVDENDNPLGVDSIGELCIAGDGLARGYLNRTELTNEKFVKNHAIEGRKMYKTGDMAKWLGNGEIEFLGRKDFQVKIRGFRIELGEIEDCLSKYEKITDCVVGVKENELGEKYLVAYYLSDKELLVSDILSFLIKSLPDYMIPGFYKRIEKMPLTANGKIDRKSLPNPDTKRPLLETQYCAPETNIENHMSEIWRRILNLEMIGINDNFFELGGNSILVSQLHIELEKYYPGKIDLVDIFAYPSISRLVKFIEDKNSEADAGRPIKALKFPSEFFTDKFDRGIEIVFKASIDKEVCTALGNLAVKNDISTYSILLVVYLNLLSEISEQREVQAFIMKDGMDQYKSLSIDFTNGTDLVELSKRIQIQTESSSQHLVYTVSDVSKTIIKERHLLPTIYFVQDRIRSDQSINELALIIKEDEVGFKLNMILNSEGLRKDKFENLLTDYVKLLHAIADSM